MVTLFTKSKLKVFQVKIIDLAFKLTAETIGGLMLLKVREEDRKFFSSNNSIV